MAAPTNTPPTGESWHLSVDDLLAPLPDSCRLGGPGPFVINLSASSAPISPPAKGIAGCQHAHVYQVQRTEDRRPRYRLRVGPFANEDEAEAILQKVRDIYPGALTATADADDMRAIATLRSKANALQPPAEKPLPVVAAAIPTLSAPVPVLMPRQADQPAKGLPGLEAAPTKSTKPTPSTEPVLSTKPVPPTQPVLSIKPVPPTQPVLSTKPVPSPQPVLSIKPVPSPQPVLSAKPVPSPQPAPSAKPTFSPPPTISPKPAPSAMPASAKSLPSEQLSRHVPSLETTQTVRALTQLELEDEQVSRWFVIQLSLAEEPFDPDTVPNLDIFSVYRLYSVAGIDQGRIVHALRLGFFTEEIAAGAVASYLAAFYDKPSIKRVSAAERERFAEQSLEPRKDVGATGKHAAIEITSERFVREKRSGQTAAK
ncbi:MAG TPA: SPOR domain-containing protein [Steroidobacteraceae bacterium]